MTAKQVNGVEVIADEAVLSPLSKPGKPVQFKNIRQLLLADERTIFGCGMEGCEFTAEKVGHIRLHFREHKGQQAQVRKVDTPPKFDDRQPPNKGKRKDVKPEAPAENDENPIDFLAALERMLAGSTDAPASADVTELKDRIAELERELAEVKEELAGAKKEHSQANDERDWWKAEHAVAVGTVRSISEIIKRSKIK